MNAHFGDPFTNRLAITKVAVFGRADAMSDTGAAYFVFQCREPRVEFDGAVKDVHVT